MRRTRIMGAWLGMVVAASAAAGAVELKSFELSETGGRSRLTLQFSGTPRYRLVQSGRATLWVADFPGAIFRETRKRLRPSSDLAAYAVASQYDRRTVRLVVKRSAEARIELDRQGQTITVDVLHPASGLRPGDPVEAAIAATTPEAAKPPPVAFPSREEGARPRIVIDPGHGGRDPGAVGPNTTDKEIALQVGLKLKELLEADERVEVHFTRTEDRFVDLEDRAALARRVGADVFVSLHANSGPRVARGFEVWYLSSRGSHKEARRLLQKSGDVPGAAGKIIQEIIVDKQREGTLNRSSLLAGFLEQALGKTGQRSRGVGEENFAVLRSVAVPSVLIELGFLSNPTEEKQLRDPAFQAKQARAIHGGLVAYLRSQGRLGEGTLSKTLHAVRRNESLSLISQRYAVDLVDLAAANGLSPEDHIFVGQLLEIPTDPVGALIGEHIE